MTLPADFHFADELAPEAEKLTRPPMRWRNRYRLSITITFCDEAEFDGVLPPGDYFRRAEWPSEEVAEQKALDLLSSEWLDCDQPPPPTVLTHLGAFPLPEDT